MTHTATRDEVFDAPRISGRMAATDVHGTPGAWFTVLGTVAGLPASVYVVSGRTGLVALVTRTGRTVRRDGMTRVRFDFPRDTGDAAGTLAFDGTRCGGWVPADVF